MRILITGSSGLLGRACARAAVARGWGVVGVDRTMPPDLPSGDPPWNTFIGNLHEPYTIHRAIDLAERELSGRIDALIHLANHTNARAATGETVLRENLAMNANAFAATIERGGTRLVFASSIQAFLGGIDGPMETLETHKPPRFPIDESIEPRPTNAYGLSKLLTEQMLDRLAGGGVLLGQVESECISAISVRLPYVLNDQSFAINRERALRGEFSPVDYRWGGPEAFAYIHVDDAAEALIAAADPSTARVNGHTLIWIAADEPRTWESAAALVDRFYADVTGAEIAAERGSFQNIERARQLLRWEPTRLLSVIRAQAVAERG